jgi:hypothetical protein
MRKPLPPLSETEPLTGERLSLRVRAEDVRSDFLDKLQVVYPRDPGRVQLYVEGKWRTMWVT